MFSESNAIYEAIDTKWAETLIGMRLKIPQWWWKGWKGNRLWEGKIVSVTLADPCNRCFVVKLLDEEPEYEGYPMHYQDVKRFVDRKQANFTSFYLPSKAPTPRQVARQEPRVAVTQSKRKSECADEPWTCACGNLLAAGRVRCGNCLCWRGGQRLNIRTTAAGDEEGCTSIVASSKKCKYVHCVTPEKPGAKITNSAYARKVNKRKSKNEEDQAASIRRSPPGPGWRHKVVSEGINCAAICHWISPTRNIEFRRRAQALVFEDLRQKHRNEVKAWNEYRRIMVGKDTCVVAAYQYDTGENPKNHIQRPGKPVVATAKKLPCKLPKASMKGARQSATTPSLQDKEMKKSNHFLDSPFKSCASSASADGLDFRNYKMVRVMPKSNTSFLCEKFLDGGYPDPVIRIETSLNNTPPTKTDIINGKRYTLASAKQIKDKGGRFGKTTKRIELVYIAIKGLQTKLEEISCFPLMTPGKIVARLAHLQSEAQDIQFVNSAEIEIMKEEGHEGK